ncbi:MAG: DNA/RNA non-specific endonuclease [Candidatus Stahlbacteria bacterium]|nr:DNA/RNA non-specific endonuclease [Candidatus Stahlbacteria bacterium]
MKRLFLILVLLVAVLILGIVLYQSRLYQPQVEFNYLPAYTSQDDIVKHTAYTLKYNEPYEQAEWVAYKLTAERVKGIAKRTDDFRSDPMVKTGSAELSDYKNSGYDRGHLAPAGDMKWSETAMYESFYMSNMSPQMPGFNRGIWKKLEDQVRDWAVENEEIYIVTGPILEAGLSTIGKNKVGVPNYFYKVILDYKKPEFKGIGFVLPNQSSQYPLESYTVSIDSVEALTGIDFFPAIPDSLENVIESSLHF